MSEAAYRTRDTTDHKWSTNPPPQCALQQVAATRAVGRRYERASTDSWAMRWPGVQADTGLFFRGVGQLPFGDNIKPVADLMRWLVG
jgi:hypothetical protein